MSEARRSERVINVADGRLSRVERLELISYAAAAGMGECPAWIVPLLERSDLNEDPMTEK